MKAYGAVYQLAWPDYKGPPPEGKPRVLAEHRIADWPGASVDEKRVPFWLSRLAREYPQYSLYWAPVMPPRRHMSQTAKASIRQKRLKARMNKKFPLFAEEFTQEDIAKDPQYFRAETHHRNA